MPDIPSALGATPEVRAKQEDAWRRLQGGDLRGASRDFSAVLKRAPGFYPAETGLGFVSLAGRQYKPAATHFSAAIAASDRYLPAWIGAAEAQLGLSNDAEAIVAMERILVLDPRRQEVRARLDLVRARQVQALIESGRRARVAGKLEEA
ncbi:MAG: hypothetical protein ABI652_08395, partial [Acidobacteriota bacterium]